MSTKYITRTAILLALTLVFQYMGRFIPLGQNSNFIVGPLVNACLIIATAFTGLWSGAIISAVAPVSAAITTHTPIAAFLFPFIPVVALGNFSLVLFFYLLKNKRIWGVNGKIWGILIGAAVKFIVLFSGVLFYVNVLGVGKDLKKAVVVLFGWPQLVTAIIGSIIALIVMAALEKAIEPLDRSTPN